MNKFYPRNMKIVDTVTAALIALAFVGVFLYAISGTAPVAKAGGSQVLSLCYDTSGNLCTATATTTAKTLGVGGTQTATTTVTVNTANATSLDINLFDTPQTTTASIQFSVQYSPNGLDWYSQDSVSTTTGPSNTTHNTVPVLHTWVPGATSTVAWVARNITISTLSEPFVRIGFQAQVATSSLYARIVPRNLIPN